MAIRVELCGRLVKAPELRVTPAGSPLLRVAVDCGESEHELVMEVVMAGERARDLARALKGGSRIRAAGALRSLRTRGPIAATPAKLEVLADNLEPMD